MHHPWCMHMFAFLPLESEGSLEAIQSQAIYRQTQRVALGDKVMSEGLRVGVAFGLTHDQSSAHWPLGCGDNS